MNGSRSSGSAADTGPATAGVAAIPFTEVAGRLLNAVALVDAAGLIRYANPAWDAMFGYPAGELVGLPLDRLHPGCSEQDTAAQAGQATWQGELRSRRKDGTEFWVDARIYRLDHPELGRVSVRVQWQIPERQPQFDDIVEAIAEAVLVVAEDGRIVRANGRVAEVFGYAEAELVGQAVERLMPEHLRRQHAGLRARFAEETRPRAMGASRELFGRRKDGSEFPVEIGLGPMRVGARRYTVVSIADVTKLRASEREVLRLNNQLTDRLAARLADTESELRASERNLRELAEHINEVFWLVSPDWRTVHYVSPAYETVWGRDRASLYLDAGAWLAAVRADDRARVSAYLAAKKAGDQSEIDLPEYRVVRPDGSERWIKAHGYGVRDPAGRICRIAGMAEDITERKLMDERLRASEERHAEAERNKVEEERRRLSLELHDEVGQMLAALNINLEMVRRRQAGPEAAEPLQNARQITAELMKTVRRIVHQLRPPQLDDLGLAAAVRGHLELLRSHAMMAVSLSENLGLERLPGPVEMTCFRVVQEALTNAVRHASAATAAVVLTRSADALSLSVSDDGVGFDPSAAPPGGPNSDHLGLRGMRERVHGLGGEFEVRSSPGKGCRITAVIPLGKDG
ncbi:PAS domain-containing sensor histidine kinase [Parasulfuritortus cantonensis]|uniref:PAS domain-containing sensor histidine kinase n=1 Tax=Parasulfuritortus cantonensis TaxID=2528202 RepID=A0A4R1BIZ7_9PROT|nr:PAS domain-containing sensor histidine kinase [Parasulfuritortus cantonensis]TCJ17187.1 PAS domain-containing sensor histidine kinase [Parasulfuritortus cantonensis]